MIHWKGEFVAGGTRRVAGTRPGSVSARTLNLGLRTSLWKGFMPRSSWRWHHRLWSLTCFSCSHFIYSVLFHSYCLLIPLLVVHGVLECNYPPVPRLPWELQLAPPWCVFPGICFFGRATLVFQRVPYWFVFLSSSIFSPLFVFVVAFLSFC